MHSPIHRSRALVSQCRGCLCERQARASQLLTDPNIAAAVTAVLTQQLQQSGSNNVSQMQVSKEVMFASAFPCELTRGRMLSLAQVLHIALQVHAQMRAAPSL